MQFCYFDNFFVNMPHMCFLKRKKSLEFEQRLRKNNKTKNLKEGVQEQKIGAKHYRLLLIIKRDTTPIA